MKKVILSVAIIAGMFITTNIQSVQAMEEQPTIAVVMDDDEGFVEVQLQDLSEVVQATISSYVQEYDINALKYNADKQLTKVELTKKDDQSTKTVYLDAEGEEVVVAPASPEEQQQEGTEIPMSL